LACSEETKPNNAFIHIALNSQTVLAPEGGRGLLTATLTRGGGYTGAVTLTVSGLPAGVAVNLSPIELVGTNTSSRITVSVLPTAVVGAYTAMVTATGDGVEPATTSYELLVSEPQSFELSIEPAQLTIVAGTSSSGTLTVRRINSFTGEIRLALESPPAGITGSLNPTSVGDTAALLVSVTSRVPAGNYPLTIRGTTDEAAAKTATIMVTVPPRHPSAGVDYLFCSAAAAPVFFAYQDGNGPWIAVPGTPLGGATRFSFSVAGTSGGVLLVHRIAATALIGDGSPVGSPKAVLQPSGLRQELRSRFRSASARTGLLRRAASGDLYLTEVYYASAAELAEDGAEYCGQTQPTKTVTGTVAGVPLGSSSILSLGGITNVVDGATHSSPVTFSDVPAGLVDLVGTRATRGRLPDRLVVIRDLNLPNGGSLPSPIDFTASSAPGTAKATVVGKAPDEFLEIFTDLVTENGRAGLWFDLTQDGNPNRWWAGLAASDMTGDDFHGLVVFATPVDFGTSSVVSTSSGSSDLRVAVKYVRAVTDQTLTLGPSITQPWVSQIGGNAYSRYRFQGALPPEYDKGASIDVMSDAGNLVSIIATGAYLAAAGDRFGYDLTMPDVVGLNGFPVESRLTAGINAVAASGFGFTGPGIFDLRPKVGTEFRAATKSMSIDVP
jgi:hypothetical protein